MISTEILAGLLADKALIVWSAGWEMEMYQTDQGDFERKYGTYLSQARRTLNGGTQLSAGFPLALRITFSRCSTASQEK